MLLGLLCRDVVAQGQHSCGNAQAVQLPLAAVPQGRRQVLRSGDKSRAEQGMDQGVFRS